MTAIEAVPCSPAGWRVLITWQSGRLQYISGFDTRDAAETWIASEARKWLRALQAQL